MQKAWQVIKELLIMAVMALILFLFIRRIEADLFRWIVAGVAGLWFFFSIRIIGPKEMAIRVILGMLLDFCDSGFHFVPLFFSYLERRPKTLYNLDYLAKMVISKAGEYPPGSGVKYGVQIFPVDAVAYLRFPRSRQGLSEIIRSQVPVDPDELLRWSDDSVVGAIRTAFGTMTWGEAITEKARVIDEANKAFKHPDGVLLKAGFEKEDLNLTIKEIRLPQGLAEALPRVDTQRLEAEAATYESEQMAEETAGAVINEFSKLKNMPRKDVQRELKKRPREFIRENKDLWEKAWDIVRWRMSIDGKAGLEIRTPSPSRSGGKKVVGEDLIERIEKLILRAIGAAMRMPMGVAEKEKEPEEKEKKTRKMKFLGIDVEVPEEET